MYDNAEAGPEWQLLTEEDWEDENLEQREYYCAICKSRLDFMKDTGTIWRCNECMEYYDVSIQDVPIKNMSESRVKVYPELDRYSTYDIEDPNMVFVEGINPDADVDEYTPSSNIEVISDDGLHKHIRVKGLPTEALAAMNEMDGR
jgi:ribosomal protein L37AE/L43A